MSKEILILGKEAFDKLKPDVQRFIKQQSQHIADLMSKLAECESKRKSLEEKVKCLSEENEECFVDGQKYNELREQKDKENQQLKQQLYDLPKKIVEDCKMALIKRINIISGYGRMTIDEQSFFFENEYGKDLDAILKKYGDKNEINND